MARKKVAKKDKIEVVKIWVPKKHVKSAQQECDRIQAKYRA